MLKKYPVSAIQNAVEGMLAQFNILIMNQMRDKQGSFLNLGFALDDFAWVTSRSNVLGAGSSSSATY